MAVSPQSPRAAVLLRTVALATVLSTSWVPASGEELGKDDIVKRLAPPLPTRSVAPPRTRRIEVVAGRQDQVLGDTQGLPSVNLQVLFELNSDVIGAAGQAVLEPLGEALRDPRLAGSRMLIGGHTDARGSEEYNQNLSERRAQSVREYLVTRYNIAPERLSSMGFGWRKLANTADPGNAVNRRVEIVNIGQQ